MPNRRRSGKKKARRVNSMKRMILGIVIGLICVIAAFYLWLLITA